MKKKMVVVLNVNPDFANAGGIAEGITSAYGPDEVTVDTVHETSFLEDESMTVMGAALFLNDVKAYAEANGITMSEDEKVSIAKKIADSESFTQFIDSEIEFWLEQEDE